MINALLIVLLVHYISLYVFPKKSNNLSCGIFGHITNNVNTIDSNAVKILGILNESRGENSCGITLDSDIFHGVDAYKKFRDFSKGAIFKPEFKPVVFGHTRKSSVGIVNTDNAHPFGFGTSLDGGFAFIGAHNGTLYNYEEMAAEFGVSLKAKHGETERVKIDSEILLECIYKSKTFKPLSYYNGGAALVWYTPDTDTVYLFSGESKNYESTLPSPVTTIERPLHVWVIDQNQFMFSSEPYPLHVVGAGSTEAVQIESNTVYVIKNGDFLNAEKIKVSRANSTQKKSHTVTTYGTGANRLLGRGRLFDQERAEAYEKRRTELEETFNEDGRTSSKKAESKTLVVDGTEGSVKYVENLNRTHSTSQQVALIPINSYGNRLYVRNLRYMRNGHAASTGVYVYIRHFGLFNIGSTFTEAVRFLETRKDYYFNITDGSVTTTKTEGDLIQMKAFENMSSTDFKYMFKGYLLLTYNDFASVCNAPSLYETAGSLNFMNISHISRFPVLASLTNYGLFLKNGIPEVSDTCTGPNFEASVTIKNGRFISQKELTRPHLVGLEILEKQKLEKRLKEEKVENAIGSKGALLAYDEILEIRKYLTYQGIHADPICNANDAEEYGAVLLDIIDLIDTAYDEYLDLCKYYHSADVSVFIDEVTIILEKKNLKLEEVIFDIINTSNFLISKMDSTSGEYLKVKNINSLLLQHGEN